MPPRTEGAAPSLERPLESSAAMHIVTPERQRWAWLALAVALLGTAGSLYLSIGMGLKACPLCFYQRTLIMSVLGVLGVGLLADRSRPGFLCMVCVPLVVAGLSVAVFHEYLVLSRKLECPKGVFGFGTAPLQSLLTFSVLTVCIMGGAIRRLATAGCASLLGVVFAWACVAGSPPMPQAPDKPYDQPLEVCRPPYDPK